MKLHLSFNRLAFFTLTCGSVITITRFPKTVQRIYFLIAIFFLITSSINFINLATAEAVNRLREVGIRKVLGSSRRELIFQFFAEALLLTVLRP